MNPSYESYGHWRTEMTENAKLTLDREYCEERIKTLSDSTHIDTRALLKSYGSGHLTQVLEWFQRAAAEA